MKMLDERVVHCFSSFLQATLLLVIGSLQLSTQNSVQLNRCPYTGPLEPAGRCIFKHWNVSQSLNINCSAEYMHGSVYNLPVMPRSYCNVKLYGKIQCQALTSAFTEKPGLSVDQRCSGEVDHSHSEENVPCTLMNDTSESCWQVTLYLRVGCEPTNASVIPVHGLNHNSEHFCIYINPAEPLASIMAQSASSPILQTSTTSIAEFSPQTNIQSLCHSTVISTAESASQSLVHPQPESKSTNASIILHQATIVRSTVQQQSSVLGRISSMAPSTNGSAPTVDFDSKGDTQTRHGLITMSLLGAVLAALSVTLVVSCVCNIVIFLKHQKCKCHHDQYQTGEHYQNLGADKQTS